MLSVKRDTFDSLSTWSDDQSRRGSTQSTTPVLTLPYPNDQRSSLTNITTALSPPPTKASPPQSLPHTTQFRTQQQQQQQPSGHGTRVRLRSDSGLSFHTNQAAFRQYTDYSSDGSVRSHSSRTSPNSIEVGSIDTAVSLSPKPNLNEALIQAKLLPDFFDPAVIKLAFSNPTIGHRLCQFAKGRDSAADMEFLVKVDEYCRAFSGLITVIGQINEDFTGVTATTPLDLPDEITNILKSNTKHCARSALPALEKLYREAKAAVEQRLTETLYPEFVKHQLSHCMRSSLSVSRTLTGGFKSAYPGLGDAFCLTDPLELDNPVVYASDAFLSLAGYQRNEILQKNCRFFQGISTDPAAIRRLSEALTAGRETTELLINHRKDGTPFWNLLFVCPLYEQGSIRYFLGAQINVSESMGSDYKDILRILNFGLSGEETAVKASTQPFDQPIWRTPISMEPERPLSSQGTHSSSHRHRFFRRFSRKSARSPSRIPRPSTPSAPLKDDVPLDRRCTTPVRSPQTDFAIDEHSTPYSRFFVMKYIPPTSIHFHHDRKYCNHTRMPIAFCSSFALNLLGLKSGGSELVLEQDIFCVLAGYTNSASAIRNLRTTVSEGMAAGEPVSVDLMATATQTTDPQSNTRPLSNNTGLNRMLSVRGGGHGHGTGEDLMVVPSSSRIGDTLDRGAEILSQVFFGPKLRKLVSHWTPLKNADGEVEFVVVILTPAAIV
ncbi:hypothetical protein QBC35DRAFT_381861 [Podospora australis]|uniref:PAS domain-containing protein n=1 Tax=Podospora australis TaxID=1536484 RepID=A0AAN7AJX5_9PEZI|nr:hypothetical protein QBC35DRAFT_381861 [Podospora australis]